MVSGFVVVNGCPVVSGLAPRWAAKRPHQEHRIYSGKTQRQFWGCFAAQRGASPLTTGHPFTTTNPLTTGHPFTTTNPLTIDSLFTSYNNPYLPWL